MNNTDNYTTGSLGEDIALIYFKKKGFTCVERNYWKKWGEIDLIMIKSGVTHFVEVKSVSREIIDPVSRETEGYRPEDNLHKRKLKRLQRVIGSYLLEKNIADDGWKFHAIFVLIDHKRKKANVSVLWDIVL